MERRSLYDIVRVLNEADVLFIITGGLAVVAHGYVRFTANVDLLIDSAPESWQRALQALGDLGYEPAFDYRPGMSILELRSAQHVRTPVLLVTATEGELQRVDQTSMVLEADPDVWLRFVSKSDLISSKRPPACILDLVDVEKLEMLPDPGAPLGHEEGEEVRRPAGRRHGAPRGRCAW